MISEAVQLFLIIDHEDENTVDVSMGFDISLLYLTVAAGDCLYGYRLNVPPTYEPIWALFDTLEVTVLVGLPSTIHTA